MKRLLFMFFALALGCMFMFFDLNWEMGFPYSNVRMLAENWFYYLFEHLVVLLLSLAIVSEATEYKKALWTFVVIQVVDTLDYILFYGEPWSKYLPTWNILKVGVFGCAVLYEVINHDN